MLEDDTRDPFRHFAVEEALLRGIDENITPPTLRLRRVEPSVWIGVYQYPGEDVDVAYCSQKGIKIVRRPNPGGAVYQDDGSFCYSLFFPKKLVFEQFCVTEAEELYALTGKAVIETCLDFGVKAELSPINDITIGGRKVYGAAQVELYSAFVHSGSFLINANLDEMERCLKPSKLKFIDKGIHSVRERVINLCEAAGKDIEIRDVMEGFVRHFGDVFNVDFYPGILSSEEILSINYLHDEKYVKPGWTFRTWNVCDSVFTIKSRSGIVTVGVSMDGDRITNIDVKGDFLISNQEELMRVIECLKGNRIGEVTAVVESARLPEDLKKSLIGLFINLKAGGNSDGSRF